jgi:hypothetical protein
LIVVITQNKGKQTKEFIRAIEESFTNAGFNNIPNIVPVMAEKFEHEDEFGSSNIKAHG